MDIYNLVSLLGLLGLLLIGWAFSTQRRRLNLRCVVAGMALQLLFGALIFLTPASRTLFLRLNDLVLRFLAAATAGQRFVFGPLALGPGQIDDAGNASVGFILATQALPMVVFFAALMGLLYYVGLMQCLVRAFAWLFARLMRVSGAEALCAAGNIFVGIESTTAVRPYLAEMTDSELCTVLTAGLATVASTTMGLYVVQLKDTFPTIAGHLIGASILSAPAAIVFSKLLVPETGRPLTLGRVADLHYQRESGPIDAVINGAMAGVRLAVGIVALLIAFLGMLAVLDMLLAAVGSWIGLWPAASPDSPIAALLGHVFRPIALLIGVPPADAPLVGRMLGTRLVATEIPAYQQLASALADGRLAHPRSAVIAAYALCGFAHVASLAIFIGGVAALVPQRRADLARIALRVLLAATLACLSTAAVAGAFYTPAAAALPPITTGP